VVGQGTLEALDQTDSAEDRRVPEWLVLVGYFVGVMVLGAALTPVLHGFGQWIKATLADSPSLENPIIGDLYKSVARSPFTRFFDRSILIAAVVLLWPALRLLRLRGGMRALGIEPNPRRWVHWGFGFCLAAGGLLALGHLLSVLGWFRLEEGISGLSKLWIAPLLTGVCVAVIEEFLFRGGMLGLLRRSMGTVAAVVVLTSLFAVVHFMEAPEGFAIAPDEVRWSSGFALLGLMLGHLGDLDVLIGQLLTLFMVGLALALIRLRSRSLWMPMGLHAGWVFGIQLHSALMDPTRPTRMGEHLPLMGHDLKTGLLPLIVVVATWFVADLYLRWDGSTKKAQPDPEGQS